MAKINYEDINKRIVDRNDLFYWQAERKITEAESASIWKDRHSAIKNKSLIKAVNKVLKEVKCTAIDEVDATKQESSGSVNSNRVGHLGNGQDVIIRCHPRGVQNGYFYVESLVAKLLIDKGLPSYKTYAIHECTSKKDCAFQVIERIQGTTVQRYLKEHPEKENDMMFEMGKTMATMHKINVEGFGPFDNKLAKQGMLKGIHDTFYDSVVAGLDFDLTTLTEHKIITKKQAQAFKKLFSKDNPLLTCKQAVLVHNDFVDWNVLTDGKVINGILDLDECVASDPLCDVACWTLFFDDKRQKAFLDGYFSVATKPKNFEKKFRLLQLRYSLTKMTLRARRYSYEQSDFMKNLIEVGKGHLKASAEYFGCK